LFNIGKYYPAISIFKLGILGVLPNVKAGKK